MVRFEEKRTVATTIKKIMLALTPSFDIDIELDPEDLG